MGSDIDRLMRENPEALYNRVDPAFAIAREKPEHRLIILLKSRGVHTKDIAHAVGLSPAWINNVLKQPWAQEALLREMKGDGVQVMQELLAGEATNSVFTILEVRDNPNAPPAVRLNAANSLLDRVMGKAVQRIESDTTHHIAADIEQVDKELAELQAEEKRLCGVSNN
jgi:hypothetical protein